MRLYLAGPLFTTAEVDFNEKLALELEKYRYECLLPQNFCAGLQPGQIASACLNTILESNVVIVNCDGADIDSGTAFEAGAAFAWQIPFIAYRTDFRRGGDTKLFPANLMISHKATALIQLVLADAEELAEEIHSHLRSL